MSDREKSVMIHYLGGACGDFLKVCIWLGLTDFEIKSKTDKSIKFSPYGEVILNENGRLQTLDTPTNKYNDATRMIRHVMEDFVKKKPSSDTFLDIVRNIIETHAKDNYKSDIITGTDISIINGHEVIEYTRDKNSYASNFYVALSKSFNIYKNVLVTQYSKESTRIQYEMSVRKNRFDVVESLNDYHNKVSNAIRKTEGMLDNVAVIELEDMIDYNKLSEFLYNEFGIDRDNNNVRLMFKFWKKAQLL